jgi:hypothetical protein
MKNESLLKKLASLVSDLEKIAGGYATNSRGDRFYDTKGYSAGEKDLQRMRDLAKRALGNESKMIQLAKQMAKSIKDQDKAFRRADAAKQIFADSDARDEIVKIFMDAGVGLASSKAASIRTASANYADASRLREIGEEILEKVASAWSESKAWALIDKIGWGKKTTDYQAVQESLVEEYDYEDMKAFRGAVRNLYDRLAEAIRSYVEDLRYEDKEHNLPYGGDDSFSDMVHHAIGLGKKYYEKVLADPASLEDLKVKESFAYCIPTEYEYKANMSDSDKIKFEAKNLKADLNKNKAILQPRFSKEFVQMERIIADIASGKIKTDEEGGKKFLAIADQMEKEIEEEQKALEKAISAVRDIQFLSDRSLLFLRLREDLK